MIAMTDGAVAQIQNLQVAGVGDGRQVCIQVEVGHLLGILISIQSFEKLLTPNCTFN